MARKPAPALVVEDVEVSGQLEQDFQATQDLGQQLSVIDASYGDGLPYDRDRLVNETRFYLGQSAEAMLEAGNRLITLKENEPHGSFEAILRERLGLPERTAQRMMQAAIKFTNPALPKAPTLALLGKSKLFELMTEDDEVLAELADGGTVAGLTLDDVDRMSARELRAALRRTRREKEENQATHEQLLASKDQKLNALDRELVERSRATAVQAWPEQVAAMNSELATLAHLATESIAPIHTWHQALALIDIPNGTAPADDPRRALVLSLHDSTARLASLVGSLQQAIFDEYAVILNQPAFDLMVEAE